MSIGTVLVIILLVLIVGAIVFWHFYSKKKTGGGGCSYGCPDCPGRSECSSAEKKKRSDESVSRH